MGLLTVGSLYAPRSSFFMWFVWMTVLAVLAVLVAPRDRRWVAPATFSAMTMLYPVIAPVLYSNLFWYVIFVPVVALVCTVVTEWARESEDGDIDQRSNR